MVYILLADGFEEIEALFARWIFCAVPVLMQKRSA